MGNPAPGATPEGFLCKSRQIGATHRGVHQPGHCVRFQVPIPAAAKMRGPIENIHLGNFEETLVRVNAVVSIPLSSTNKSLDAIAAVIVRGTNSATRGAFVSFFSSTIGLPVLTIVVSAI